MIQIRLILLATTAISTLQMSSLSAHADAASYVVAQAAPPEEKKAPGVPPKTPPPPAARPAPPPPPDPPPSKGIVGTKLGVNAHNVS